MPLLAPLVPGGHSWPWRTAPMRARIPAMIELRRLLASGDVFLERAVTGLTLVSIHLKAEP